MIRKNIWIVRDDLRVSGVYHQQLRPTSGRSINMLELKTVTQRTLSNAQHGFSKECTDETRGSFTNHRRVPAAFLSGSGLRRESPWGSGQGCGPVGYRRYGCCIVRRYYGGGRHRSESSGSGRQPQHQLPVPYFSNWTKLTPKLRRSRHRKLRCRNDRDAQSARQLPVRQRLLAASAVSAARSDPSRCLALSAGAPPAPLVVGSLLSHFEK